MNLLTVFYDEQCELCQRCRAWLSRQPGYVRLEFIPLQSPLLERRYPGLSNLRPDQEILVVSDEGGIYRGGAAWMMCLWATKTYREWSLRLASPALFPMVKKFVSLVSANRLSISTLLSKREPEDLALEIEALHEADEFCASGTCSPR